MILEVEVFEFLSLINAHNQYFVTHVINLPLSMGPLLTQTWTDIKDWDKYLDSIE